MSERAGERVREEVINARIREVHQISKGGKNCSGCRTVFPGALLYLAEQLQRARRSLRTALLLERRAAGQRGSQISAFLGLSHGDKGR